MKNIKSFSSFLNESFNYEEWLEAFESFLDSTWQEDNEIEIVAQLNQHRKNFKGRAKETRDYLTRWAKENEKLLDGILPNTSEAFQAELENLINGVWKDPAGGSHGFNDDEDLAAGYE